MSFKGIALDIHRSSLPEGLYQTDVGGDRFEQSRWRRRRGARRTSVATKATAITAILGFEMNSASYGVILVGGSTACGFVNVSQQSWIQGGGYGESEYGGEPYGE